MDPDNLDIYGGVTHAEYCFQVRFHVCFFFFLGKISNFISVHQDGAKYHTERACIIFAQK